MSQKIIIKNSSGTTTPTLQYGELAINFKSGSETLYTKNSNNEIIAFNDWAKILNKPTTLSGYGITDALNTSSTSQTKSGALTLTGGFRSEMPAQNYNPFSSYKIFDSIDTNLLIGRANKIKVSVNGVENTTASNSLFNQNYEEYNIVCGREGDAPLTLNIDLVSKGLYGGNGITYASGYVYLHFYSAPLLPATYTARVKDKDNVWTNMTLTPVTSSTLKGTIPIALYLKELEFTFTTGTGSPYVTSNIKWGLTEVEYHGTRMSLSQGGKISSVGGYIGGSLTVDGGVVGNASSATKLASTRTIYGQNFDGTQNIYGTIKDVDTIQFSSSPYQSTYVWANNNGLHLNCNSGNELGLTISPNQNVRIGTSTDAGYKLDVNGSTRISGSLSITDTIIRSNAYAVDSDVYGNLNWKTGAENWYNWNVGGIMCVFKSGNVMIGSTTDSGHKLNVNGVLRNIYEGDPLTGEIVSKSLAYNSSPYGLITRIYSTGVVSLQSQRESNNSETFGLTLQPLGGNVGIGTTSTSYKLDVSGTFRVNYNYSTTFTGNDINFTRTDGSSYINAGQTLSLGAGGTSGVLNLTNANVATFKELLLADGARIYSAAGAGLGISLFNEPSFNPNYGLMFAQTVYKGKHGAVSGDWATYFTMSPDAGRGWIFTNSASSSGGNVASISNTGNLTCSGEVTAYSASDIRLKANIRPITSAIDVINKLNPVQYNWNSVAKELNPLKGDSTEYGLIAQELEKVMPELVHTIYDKYKSIDYVKLVPILIKGMQELKAEINELKNK